MVGGHKHTIDVLEVSDQAAKTKAKAIVAALSRSLAYMKAEWFEVEGPLTDEDWG